MRKTVQVSENTLESPESRTKREKRWHQELQSRVLITDERREMFEPLARCLRCTMGGTELEAMLRNNFNGRGELHCELRF